MDLKKDNNILVQCILFGISFERCSHIIYINVNISMSYNVIFNRYVFSKHI